MMYTGGISTVCDNLGPQFSIKSGDQCRLEYVPVLCIVLIVIGLQGKLLGALMAGLTDRSTGVRKAYARAIGHLVKVCFMLETHTHLLTYAP